LLKSFLIAGFLQGFLLALFFLFHKVVINKTAHRFLGVLLLLLSFHLLAAAFYAAGELTNYPNLLRLPELLPFLYPPLIYGYTASLIYQEQWFSKNYVMWLLPLIAGVFLLSPFWMQTVPEKITTYQQMLNGKYPPDYTLLFWSKSLFGLFGILKSFQLLIKAVKEVKYLFAATEDNQLQWLRYFLSVLLALWVIGTARYIAGFSTKSVFAGGIAVTSMIYILSYFTLRQKQLFNQQDLELIKDIETGNTQPDITVLVKEEVLPEPLKSTDQQETPVEVNKPEEGIVSQPYGINEKATELYQHILQTTLLQKAHLNKNISLQQLATLCGIRANVVSEVLNKFYQKNFYDFINELRAKEVVTRLQDNSFSHLTIDALAEECGFKSKSTFYQSFKKLTGQTPTQYKKGLSA
jgi:AraC-like DNA-binding protein